jgi:hypothetical protein
MAGSTETPAAQRGNSERIVSRLRQEYVSNLGSSLLAARRRGEISDHQMVYGLIDQLTPEEKREFLSAVRAAQSTESRG